jgi:hypothetical protein
MTNNFFVYLLEIKHQLLHCHTYFRVLHEIKSVTLLQQLRKIKSFDILSTSINQHYKSLHVLFTGSFELMNYMYQFV